MSEQKQELTLEQYIQVLRNQIVISHESAKEVSLKNFDDMAKRFSDTHNVLLAQKAKEKPELPSTTGTISEQPKTD